MKKITPFLWFDSDAEEAMKFYAGIFPDAKIGPVKYYPEGGPMPAGSVMWVGFELAGQQFYAMNAGPHFRFNEAVSFYVSCADQKEVDYYWDKLTSDGGMEQPCGWLKDRFGLSWQIIPDQLEQLMGSSDPATAQRVMAAMMKMKKIIVADLEAAARG